MVGLAPPGAEISTTSSSSSVRSQPSTCSQKRASAEGSEASTMSSVKRLPTAEPLLVDPRLLGQAQHPFAHDVLPDLVGAAGDAHPRHPAHAPRPNQLPTHP